MSNLGVEYCDRNPTSRESLQMLPAYKDNYFNGIGDPSIQLMEALHQSARTNNKINIPSHTLKCHNGGPKSDGEWYDPNQAGQQVTAHCVIL